MSTRQVSDRNDPVIESRDQLVAPMIKGEKPREQWRIGTEHEKLVFSTADHHAPSYDEPGGIRDLLMALTDFGWEPILEGGKVIAMAGSEELSAQPSLADGRAAAEIVAPLTVSRETDLEFGAIVSSSSLR